MSEEIFSEIEEDLHKERMKRLWSKYGKFLIGGVLSIIILVGGWQSFGIWQKSRFNNASNLYFNIIESSESNSELALNKITSAKNLPGGYNLLLRFKNAEVLSKLNDISASQKIWEGILLDESIEKEYREIAIILAVLNGNEKKEIFDLFNQISNVNSQMGLVALEIKAGKIFQDGEKKKAEKIYSEILDSSFANNRTKERIKSILMSLGEI